MKASVAEDIKTVLAFDLLDKPARLSPIRTRSLTRHTKNKGNANKRKNTHTSQQHQPHKKIKCQPGDLENADSDKPEMTSLADFIRTFQDCSKDGAWEHE